MTFGSIGSDAISDVPVRENGKVVLAPDIITISGPIKPLEIAARGDPSIRHPRCLA